METPIIRHAARVILLDAGGCVLLIRASFESKKWLWLTPGGGLEGGESHEDAARRELFEETGLTGIELGPCVWDRRHVFTLNAALYDAREHYYVARVDRDVDISIVHRTELEREMLAEHRWWSADEIAASSEFFVPSALAELLPPLIQGDYPDLPLVIGP